MTEQRTVVNSAILDAMHSGAIDNSQTYGRIAERLTHAVMCALGKARLAEPKQPGQTVDPGLDAAIQRVAEILNDHLEDGANCTCGWVHLSDEVPYWAHFAEVLARAARKGVVETYAKADEYARQVESLESQIHDDDGFISRMVDADAEVERLSALLESVQENP